MRVLIVDDERNIRRSLRALLEREGYRVDEAGSAEEGIETARTTPPDVLLLDLMLPGMSGLDALPGIRECAPASPVIMMSGRASLRDAVEATRRGAFHFIEKPLTPEAVLLTIQGALEVARARELSRTLIAELDPGRRIVGVSPAIREVRDTLARVAPTDARVLITGESGTGKELAAAAIHELSERQGGPFVRVNSAAIPRELVESEMFGHEAGAFTGATERRRGRFELADGGTLFLDEIGDLGSSAQAKLLRAIESGVIERVGGDEPIEVDVRLIAATNRDLEAEVAAGRFRADLLYRLYVIPVHMPALRERPEDIPELIRHIQERLRTRQGLTPITLEADAVTELQRYSWPGNVRELSNVVERLTILGGGGRADAGSVRRMLAAGPGSSSESPVPPGAKGATDAGGTAPSEPRSLAKQMQEFEGTLIRQALDAADQNIAEAARLLQTDRANLYRRMRRLGLRD